MGDAAEAVLQVEMWEFFVALVVIHKRKESADELSYPTINGKKSSTRKNFWAKHSD